MSSLRIVVVDDHEAIRRGIRAVLSARPEWSICGEAANGVEAVEQATSTRPDVVLMDVAMPRMDGLQATRIIRSQVPESHIIIVSQNDRAVVAQQAAEAGASGYVPKNELSVALVDTIDKITGPRPVGNLRTISSIDFPNGTVQPFRRNENMPPSDAVDITDRKLVEARLQEGERRFREMIDALPAAIYTTDAEGRLTHFNPASVEFSGRVPELGTDHWCVSWKLFNADGTPMPHDECPMAIALREGRIVDGVEAIAERPDGSRVWFTPYPRTLHDADGNVVGGINMLLDITARKDAERAGSHMAAIVDSSDDIIISKNLDGIISSWNKSAERILGYTPEEAIGRHISLIVPPEYRDEEATILKRLRKGERVEHFETVRVAKNGTRLDLSLTISPVKDRRGRVIGASKVARDIGDKKRAERALQESQEQLRVFAERLEEQVRIRTRELEERNAEILQQSDQLRELSSRLLRTQDEERRRIARELHDSAGQIVTALGMNLSGIAAHVEQNPQAKKGVAECKDLVGQLSKEIRTMSYLLHPPLLDETGLSHAIRWYAQGLAERSELKIEVDIPENFGRLSSELELAMFRIVQECLTNIHRHSESKTARITLSRNHETACLAIQDEGKGISTEKLAGIQAQRSGVGFTGMRERVRHLKGDLEIQSGGKGTKILVTFPIPESDEAEADRAATPPTGLENSEVSGAIATSAD